MLAGHLERKVASFTRPRVILNLYDFLSSACGKQKIYFFGPSVILVLIYTLLLYLLIV